jgi:ADP-ribose pyrophosphatase YjhB (NUDIX family)
VLLTRRARAPYAGTWDVPGGFLEADERPEAGLRRELEEELGITPRRQRLLGFATDRYGRGGFPILTLLYRVMPRPGAFQPADDVAEARWFPRAAMPWRQIAFPGLRRLLQHHLAPRRPANPRRPRASR